MNEHSTSSANKIAVPTRVSWLFSWPLLIGSLVYLFTLNVGKSLLKDGDTFWHIATGHWIMQNGAVPKVDPFSHTMPGAPWTAHEWLAEVLLALAHDAGGWSGVVAITAIFFATTIALLTRALLHWLEPIYAVLFAVLAVGLTAPHLLARPHILATPLMLAWMIELVRASEARRAPSLWLLPVMTLWANMHGGFTLGLALACAFALEALLAARAERRTAVTVKSWGIFLALALASSLATPHGFKGILFTWQMFFESSYALGKIGEWQSPSFHAIGPLEIWLLTGLALILHQGLRLPPIRLLLLLGFLHLALKHARNIELLGLLVPLLLAQPLAQQWAQKQVTDPQAETLDRFFRKLAQAAGAGAVLVTLGVLLSLTLLVSRARPLTPPEFAAPALAIAAAKEAGIKGPVLNFYSWGGYLIYLGIPTFIDGRADMYRDEFLKTFLEALGLTSKDGLEKILHQYKIEWTLLPPGSPAVTLLDHLPEWHRLYEDKTAVIHVRNKNTAEMGR